MRTGDNAPMLADIVALPDDSTRIIGDPLAGKCTGVGCALRPATDTRPPPTIAPAAKTIACTKVELDMVEVDKRLVPSQLRDLFQLVTFFHQCPAKRRLSKSQTTTIPILRLNSSKLTFLYGTLPWTRMIISLHPCRRVM